MATALYDTIGRTYDTTRRADPDLVRAIARHLHLTPGARYLDVGCGTGNYTVALQNLGAKMHGVELSSTMLSKARLKSDRVTWIHGNAEQLPFRDRSFAGAITTFTIHHMENPARTFAEVHRTIDSGSFVIMAADHEQVNRYWLKEYFPVGIAKAAQVGPSLDEGVATLKGAGFSRIDVDRWDVSETLSDWFLYAGKHRPEIYLDPTVRAGISCFAQGLITPEETAAGCARLEVDIESGRFAEVAARYRHDLGDYLFAIASKD
jgi:ubiquinone/menaquinone biosynthesis C-methylase UbiE